MSSSPANLNALHHVYHGETHEYATVANAAFDERTRAANALANLLADRTIQAEATPEDADVGYSEPWDQLQLEATNLAAANQNFEFFVSMAASVTPSREVFGDIDNGDLAAIKDRAPVYSGPHGL